MDDTFPDGFLREPVTCTLDVSTDCLQEVQSRLAVLRRTPDQVEVEIHNGKSKVHVSFYAGTPEGVFEQVKKRLQIIETKFGR